MDDARHRELTRLLSASVAADDVALHATNAEMTEMLGWRAKAEKLDRLTLAGPGFTVEEWEDLRDCIKVSRQEHFSHLEDGQKASRERHAALWDKAVALLAKLDAYLKGVNQ